MCCLRAISIGFAMPLLGILAAATSAHAAPGDEYWDSHCYRRGLDATVNALTTNGAGTVYVSGSFVTADNVVVTRVAMWDGTSWRGLRGGFNNVARVLAVGSSGDLYAGGGFTDVGDDPDADRIAVWNGSSWSSLGGPGSGLNGEVYAIAFAPNGDLVAGGSFSDAGGDPDADRIAVWNGSEWSSIGGANSGIGSTVLAVAFSSGGTLVIGGQFTNAGGDATADYIAGWNGSTWSAIGGGLNGSVSALEFAANGDLYVGGSFTDAGGDPNADRIAIWSSPTWSSVGGVGSGLGAPVYAIAFGESGGLVVGGGFTDAGGDPEADRVATWTASGWSSIGGSRSGLGQNVHKLAYDSTAGLVVGGQFENAGGDPDADFVARWGGSNWEAVTRASLADGLGLNEPVRALAIDSQGRLYAGGEFEDAGGAWAGDFVAMLDSSGWHTLGGPLAPLDFYVHAIAVLPGDQIVAGGEFEDAGGDPDADFVAVWDGVGWSALSGPGGGLDNYVYSLAVSDDGLLYAGGDFSDAGGDPEADYLAVWDGVEWSALVGPGGGVDGIVYEIAFDAAGGLYVGGDFSDAGGDPDADYIAVWDGTAWQSLNGPGSALDDTVRALAFDSQGLLYAGGEGPSGSEDIAVWDGVSWSPVGGGLNGAVFDLVVDAADYVYAVGEFQPRTSQPDMPSGIAVWNGVAWSDLGSGLDSDAFALAWDGVRNLYVGGSFKTAGGRSSNRIGLYTGTTPPTEIFSDGFEAGDTSGWSTPAP